MLPGFFLSIGVSPACKAVRRFALCTVAFPRKTV